MEGLTFRRATPADTERIAEIIHGEPAQETVRMCGSVERARAMAYELVRMPGSAQGWDRSVVGELGGESELHVHPRYRNRGIGSAALDYAEVEAQRLGHRHMSLTTTTTNPARRLYERRGFRVVETRTDPMYERYTGIPGRHLMVKELE